MTPEEEDALLRDLSAADKDLSKMPLLGLVLMAIAALALWWFVSN